VSRRAPVRALSGAALVGALLGAGPARAEPPLTAKLACEPGRAPGRVLCTLEVSASGASEHRLAWADALVLETPPFARALRTRVAARELGSPVRLTLALVLEAPGRGALRVRARTVLCRKAGAKERCAPSTRDVEAELVATK
jgi:hypothetical protein